MALPDFATLCRKPHTAYMDAKIRDAPTFEKNDNLSDADYMERHPKSRLAESRESIVAEFFCIQRRPITDDDADADNVASADCLASPASQRILAGNTQFGRQRGRRNIPKSASIQFAIRIEVNTKRGGSTQK